MVASTAKLQPEANDTTSQVQLLSEAKGMASQDLLTPEANGASSQALFLTPVSSPQLCHQIPARMLPAHHPQYAPCLLPGSFGTCQLDGQCLSRDLGFYLDIIPSGAGPLRVVFVGASEEVSFIGDRGLEYVLFSPLCRALLAETSACLSVNMLLLQLLLSQLAFHDIWV